MGYPHTGNPSTLNPPFPYMMTRPAHAACHSSRHRTVLSAAEMSMQTTILKVDCRLPDCDGRRCLRHRPVSTFISTRNPPSPVSIPGSTIRDLKKQAKDDAKAASLREKAAKLRLDATKLETKAARHKAKAQELEGQANRLSKRPIQVPAAQPRLAPSEPEP